MNFIPHFEKIISRNKTEELVLDDIVGDILKISLQYSVILLIVLILVINYYLAYFNKP